MDVADFFKDASASPKTIAEELLYSMGVAGFTPERAPLSA